MRRSGTPLNLVGVIILAGGFASACGSSQPGSEAATAQGVAATVDVTVTEGTSMSVAVSPDGQTLAIDLQGSIWTLPASGGAATRITDVFNDARQPVWSPDGGTIAFFSFRDGGYDIWAVEPDGTNQRKLTWGPFDDREPAWSHDGTRLAFASDRGGPLGGDYNVWVLDVRNGDLQQVTTDPSNDFMPSWSPDDTELAFISQRDDPAGGGRRAGPRGAPSGDSRASLPAPTRPPGGPAVTSCITRPPRVRAAWRSTESR